MTVSRRHVLCLLAATFLSCASASADTNSAAIYLSCLVDFERYAESIWHPATYANAPGDAGYFGDGGSSGNGGIRGSCGVAVAYAVLVNAQPNDPNTSNRLSRIRQALNYAAGAHVSSSNLCVDGHQWGWSSSTSTDWQTPEWSGSMGLACILVQNQLPAATVQGCQRVVASEANHRAGIAPPSGHVSDTKAEENAWDSNILSLGAAWMNTNANAANWLTAAKKYLANSYTVANTNGDPLASWITTVTLYPDFALENHGFYHPTYQMVAGMSMGDSLLMANLANPAIGTQLQSFAEHNVLNVWSNENHILLDSGEFAAPAGLDWELHDYEHNSYIAWLASHFNDPLARFADGELAQLVRYRQIVNGDGTFVGPSSGGFYREAVEARRTAIAWLHWANAVYLTGPTNAPTTAFESLTDVGVIAHRGPFGFMSLCFGPQTNGSAARVMGIIEPASVSVPGNVFVTTPRLPGIIGLGALGTPTAGRLVSLTTNLNGFQAELQLTNGGNGTTEVYVNCAGESVGIVEVPWPNASMGGGSAGSFCVGIENDPLLGGSTVVEWPSNSVTFTNRSGRAQNISNHWVCVSGRYGLAAGPAGYFNYTTASGYNRLGAAEDTLQFVTQNQLGARYAVWFPGKNAAQTSSNASLISWSTNGTNATLTFPGFGGVPMQIFATLPPAPPAYPPYLLPVSSVTASSSQSGFPPSNVTNGNYTDFWVSSGTTQGQGPTTNHPEWVQFTFPRLCAVSEFQVYPRTLNGGYGPKAVQLLLNGASAYQGTMAATTTLDVHFSPPLPATNAELLITSSYDPSFPTNSRNVQIMELSFFERAQPGTFGDWMLQKFTDAQLANAPVGGANGDADNDGVPNLMEFAVGGDPFTADAALAKMQTMTSSNTFTLMFRERKDLGDVQRQFKISGDMVNWTNATPSQMTIVGNLTNAYLRAATFPMQPSNGYYRLEYSAP